MTPEEKRELIELHAEEGAMIFEGLDDAIEGISEQFGMPSSVVYNKNKCLDIFQEQGMTYEEALEWFDFNVIGLGGHASPVFFTSISDLA